MPSSTKAIPIGPSVLALAAVAASMAVLLVRQHNPKEKMSLDSSSNSHPNACVTNGNSSTSTPNGSSCCADKRIVDQLPPLTDDQKDALAATAQTLATRGKGILAADESPRTVGETMEVPWYQITGRWEVTD